MNNLFATFSSASVEPPTIIREVLFAPQCPREVAELYEIALAYHNASNYEAAVANYLAALSKWELLLGWENISPEDVAAYKVLPEADKAAFERNVVEPVAASPEARIFVRLSVGGVFLSAGADEHALAEYLAAQRIAQVIPADSLIHASISTCLGNAYCCIAQYDLAGDCFLRALDVRERVLTSEHPDTATALANVAAVLHFLGRSEKAVEFYEKALRVLRNHFVLSHPRVVAVERNLRRARRLALSVGPHNFAPSTLITPHVPVDVVLPPVMQRQAKKKAAAKGAGNTGAKAQNKSKR